MRLIKLSGKAEALDTLVGDNGAAYSARFARGSKLNELMGTYRKIINNQLASNESEHEAHETDTKLENSNSARSYDQGAEGFSRDCFLE
jgi:hypothetical protein